MIALSNRTTTLYDAAGDVTAALDAAGNETQYLYDALNRQTVTIDANSHRTTMLYDQAGNVTSVTDPLSHTTQYEYDALNRLRTSHWSALPAVRLLHQRQDPAAARNLSPRQMAEIISWHKRF